MKLILRPTKPSMRWRWKVALGIFAIVGFLLAQSPVSQGPQASNAAAWLMSVSTWAGGTLGSMVNYGSNPGAVLVPGVNAYITNTPAVTISGTPPVSFGPVTTAGGATTMYHHVSSTSAGLNIKASAGNLYGFVAFNPNPTPCYLQFYNSAGVPTIGTSVIDSYGVEAGLTQQVLGTVALENFGTGIAYATATADAGATACTIGMSVSIFFQ